ncbi:gamma-glutamyl kinase [Jannaschia marina]|uniref:gamma-glutamyl kinase n=1 Tax=Jannaschia marina TaxID=2741674 RepID=UPI0015CAE4E0|nr:gamma-glutamyl kinase [Jannaschia marina]
MLIFWKARLVVFAVPKTGTTALEEALAPVADAAIVNPPGLKHCTVRKYRRELAPFFEQKGRRPLETLAVMREPVDWLGSWFRYRARPGLDGQPNSTAGMSFDAFVEAYLSEDPPPFARVGSQATFLEGGVDHLFRHDDQPRLIRFLEDRLEREIQLGRANVSPEGATDLSPALAARLRTDRAADFALWESLQGA